MKLIHFYALRNDIAAVLDAVEHEASLHYICTGNSVRPDFATYARWMDLPSLGDADSDSGIGCRTFLVASASTSFAVRTIRGESGQPRYCMDQLHNPDTVALCPAGLWAGEVILQGRIGTASDSTPSQALMKMFNSAFKKRFTQVQAWRVGPEALAFLKAGKRLTQAVQCPPEYNLAFE